MFDTSAFDAGQQMLAGKAAERDCRRLFVLRMGGGKTAAALEAIRRTFADGSARDALVLAPKAVAQHVWMAEARKWRELDALNVVTLTGLSAEKRRNAIVSAQGRSVFVLNYDLLPWLMASDVPHVRRSLFDFVVFDEVSRLKDATGRWSKLARRLSRLAARVVGLTGTPRPDSWLDLWSVLQVISGDYAWSLSFRKWREAYFRPLDFHGYRWELREESRSTLEQVAARWITVLPRPKRAQVEVRVQDHLVDVLSDEAARRDIRSLERDLVVELGLPHNARPDRLAGDPEFVRALTKAVASNKIDQILQGFLYGDYSNSGSCGEGYSKPVVCYKPAKMVALLELVEQAPDENIVVVYRYREDRERLRCALPGARDVTEEGAVDAWNAGKLKHLLLHPASASHGLNLQYGGSRMIFYAMPWSADQWEQTVARLARPGQKEIVNVHRILADYWQEQVRIERVRDKVASQEAFVERMAGC